MLFKQGMITVPVSGQSLTQPDRILGAILQMSNALSLCRTLQQVLSSGLELVMGFFMLGMGRVYLVDDTGANLDIAASVGIDTRGLEKIKFGEGFSGQAAQTRSFLAQRVDDLKDPERAARLKALGLRCVICLPLIADGQVFGVMNLGARRVLGLNYRTIDGFTILGNMMAVAAKNAQSRQELNQAATQLAEQNEAIRFFAYTASHDLKSPAIAVRGLADRLQKVCAAHLSGKELAIVEQIAKASGLLADLAGEINTYIQAKNCEMTLEEVPLGEVLAEVKRDVADQLKVRKVAWRDFTGNPKLKANALALRRILQNLVDNALKYGGAELSSISIGHRREADQHVLWVKDDGPGLTASQAEQVFELFKRGENHNGTTGSGLGLAIVTELARRHGGKAWAECQPQKGCTFCFSLDAG